MFRGANSINLDPKGRLAIPSRYRDELLHAYHGRMVVTVDAMDPCLSLYPLSEWQLIEASLKSLPSLRVEVRRLQRLLIGNAVDLELDSQGRFLLPARLREHAGFEKQVMLVGQLNKFQIWSGSAWEAIAKEDEKAVKESGGIPDALGDLIL